MITREHRELEDAVRKVVMMSEAAQRMKKLEAIAEAARAFCDNSDEYDYMTYDEYYGKLKAAVDALYGVNNEER